MRAYGPATTALMGGRQTTLVDVIWTFTSPNKVFVVVFPPAEEAWLDISCFTWDGTMSVLSLPYIPGWRNIFAPCCLINLINIFLTLGIATPGNKFFFWKLLGTWSIRTDTRIPMYETAHVGGCRCNLGGFPTGEKDKKYYFITYCKKK